MMDAVLTSPFFGLALTAAAWCLGVWVQKKTKWVLCNPLLIASLVIIALLAAIIIRVLLVARRAETPFHCYVCVGVAAMLIFQTIINIGMCLFIMPVIGITLPFFSYGGTALMIQLAEMGIMLNVSRQCIKKK